MNRSLSIFSGSTSPAARCVLGAALLALTVGATAHAGGGGLGGPYQLETTGQDTLGTVNETARLTSDMHQRFYHEDAAQWQLSQLMLQETTSNIIEWVKTGADGDPIFIQNLPEFLTEHVDRAVQQYIQDLDSVLDSPFSADIQGALQNVHTQNMRGELPGYNAQSIGNTDAFLSGDFTQGGWEGFYETISNPEQNTPVGAYFLAKREMERVAREKEFEEITKANWGSGFQSLEECDQNGLNCQVTTPGEVITDQLTRALGTSFDSLVAANNMDQSVEQSFAQLAERAVSGPDGLLGLSLELLAAIIDGVGSGEGGSMTQADQEAIAKQFHAVEERMNASLETEEAYLDLLERAIENQPDNQRYVEARNQTLENIAELNDLQVRYQRILDGQGGDDSLVAIGSDYTDLRYQLHNRGDVQALRTEL